MVRRIKLMADYTSEPLWDMDPDEREIDPRSLPLRRETIHRLDHWAYIFDSILNMDDPASSDFQTEAEEEDWVQEGILLWKRLQQELGPEYKVYFLVPEFPSMLASPEEVDKLFAGKYTNAESPYSPALIKERIRAFVPANELDN